MATLTKDNILSFPESGRAVSGHWGSSLAEPRDLVARRLRETLRRWVVQLRQDLTRQGDEAADRECRKFLYDTQDALMERSGRLESQLVIHWQKGFDAAAEFHPRPRACVPNGADWQLVMNADLDEDLLLRSLAGSLRDMAEDDVYAVGRRLGALAGLRSETADFNPASPEIVCRALRDALREVGFASGQRLVLLRALEAGFAPALAPTYAELNGLLLRRGLLPDLKRSFAPTKRPTAEAKPVKSGPVASDDIFPLLQKLVAASTGGGVRAEAVSGSPAAPEQIWESLNALQRENGAGEASTADVPAVNALHEFRAGPVGRSLGEFDAVTVDIVAMLFDLIFNDKEIADSIKSLVGRMQIPILKVAMLDKSFFASNAHPARRLLDGISRAALRWGKAVDHQDPLYRHVSQLVDRVRNEFQRDAGLFESLCVELDAFLRSDEQAAEGRALCALPLLVDREREELAAQAAHLAVAAWTTEPLPPTLTDLLDHEWRQLLIRCRLDGDDEAERTAIRVADELVWSVREKADAAERKALVTRLPGLVRELQLGFDRLGTDPDRRLAVTDALFGLHAAVLRGTEAPEAAVVASLPADEKLTSQAVENGDLLLENISVSPAADLPAEAARRAEELQRGDWVEFARGDEAPLRYRLSWISPLRGILLFTNPQTPKAIAVSPSALAVQIQRGEASVVRAEPVFERAVSRALGGLMAA